MRKCLLIFAACLLIPGVSVAQTGENLTIVALGDSTTAGSPAFQSPAERPPDGAGDPQSQYAYWVEKMEPGWKVVNRGILGERSDEILRRFDTDVLAYRPGLVIVLAGVNDIYQGYPAETVTKNLEAIYRRAREAKIPILACTVLPYNFASRKARQGIADVNAWIESYSREHGLGFCDTFQAVEDPVYPGRLGSTRDGLHPDVEGYRKMAEVIVRCLKQWLAEHPQTV